MKPIKLTFAILVFSLQVFGRAEESIEVATGPPSIGLSSSEFLILALIIFIIVVVFTSNVLFKALKVIVTEQIKPTKYVKYKAPAPLDYESYLEQKKTTPNVWTKLLSLKPLEEEETLIIPHAYDGIHELNNPVPRWFNIHFYGSILFGISYLSYYHIADGPRQDDEYITEMEDAATSRRIFLARSAEKYDETTVKVDAILVEHGKAVFLANCTACHGEHGQGKVGPNLTDEYWLHGGSINDVFKTVKYGVPAKGMASWEKNLSSKSIAEVANYIHALQGTKPADPKAPQGDKYEAKP